ncbi:MAG: transglycosylase SLT domain-containing protein [Mariprofundus sp.]|nr:transglycosylase SLT domain-containing protein [Mariprofundus sp.]
MWKVVRFSLLCLLCSTVAQTSVQGATIEQQRGWFKQASQALNKKQMVVFSKLKEKLVDYPLAPYLDIWQIKKELRAGNDTHVSAILTKYPDIPDAYDLHRDWLRQLAKQAKWEQVAEQLKRQPKLKKRLPYIALMSEWYTGKRDLALSKFSTLWLKQNINRKITDPLYHAWLKKGHPSKSERWRLVLRLAHHGRWKASKKISSTMSKSAQHYLAYWQRLQKDPETVFKHWPAALSQKKPRYVGLSKAMIRDGLKRLARKDPVKAYAALEHLAKKVQFTSDIHFYDGIKKSIALRAARRHMGIAAAWLESLPQAQKNHDTREWQLRVLLLQKAWPKLLASIAVMPIAEQRQANWQYWQGYALLMTGERELAKKNFRKLASGRGYYSFLSADQLQLPYQFNSKTVDISAARLQQLSDRPAMKRAYEWLQLAHYLKANREWNRAMADASKQEWRASMIISSGWNWPNQAIRSAYKGGALNALEERFPLNFEADVLLAAEETGLSPITIWSIIRQESAFNQHAGSRVGAKGLMQLMPKTAAMVAKKMKMRVKKPDLFSSKTNIRLGSRYLADMKARFDGKLELAAAAYNAGPHRVNKWLKRNSFNQPAIWVETIPFNETRSYVQHVMAYEIVYSWRREQQAEKIALQKSRALKKKNFSLLLDTKVEILAD